jgi:hypothetical protein
MMDHPSSLPGSQSLSGNLVQRYPLVGDLVVVAHLALLEPRELKIQGHQRKTRRRPLRINYWAARRSGGPGSGKGHAVKYSAVSHRPASPPPPSHRRSRRLPHPHALPISAVAGGRLRFQSATQTDPVAMPVEDVSVEWDETVPPPSPRRFIPPQQIGTYGDLATRCEPMSFSPWHALAEHRPMGGIKPPPPTASSSAACRTS